MTYLRRLSIAVLIVLIAAGAAGGVSAYTGQVRAGQPAQTAQTPAEICAAAVPEAAEPATRTFDAAEQVLQDGVDYWAVMCTEAGPIYLDLYEAESPLTVNNFVFLVQQGFYNNTTFHRVIPGFMAQGGDPTGTGSGGPGYTFADETDNDLTFDTVGLLAMANAGTDTNGSQFFITDALTSWLDGEHTIFGKVYQGLDVVELLTPRDPEQAPDFDGSALYTVVIVDDPSSVQATPDGVPTLDHLQTLLVQDIPTQLNTQFVLDEAASQATDPAAEAAAWGEKGGDDLASYMQTFLADHGFAGTAAIWLPLGTCPETLSDLPVWAIGFQVQDYSTAEGAQTAVFDDDRADQLVAAGVFDAYSDPTDVAGRMFTHKLSEDGNCGPNGTYYRLEVPYGRYVMVAELSLDSDYISETSDPSAVEYLSYVMQDFLYQSLGGTLDRGNDLAE